MLSCLSTVAWGHATCLPPYMMKHLGVVSWGNLCTTFAYFNMHLNTQASTLGWPAVQNIPWSLDPPLWDMMGTIKWFLMLVAGHVTYVFLILFCRPSWSLQTSPVPKRFWPLSLCSPWTLCSTTLLPAETRCLPYAENSSPVKETTWPCWTSTGPSRKSVEIG